MSNTSRLLVAAALLVAGLVAALIIPPGMCPDGGRLDPAPPPDGDYWCHVSDVGYSAWSLMPFKIGVAILAVVAAAVLAVPVLMRRRVGASSG